MPQVDGSCVAQNVGGAVVPAATGAHEPRPLTLQAWHAEQVADPQQTPSTQLPVMHWLPWAQTAPFGLRAQLRFAPAPWHVNGATQSASAAHVVLHAAAAQT